MDPSSQVDIARRSANERSCPRPPAPDELADTLADLEALGLIRFAERDASTSQRDRDETTAARFAAETTAVLPSIPADTPTSRCEFYRRTCDLDAYVQPELQAIIVLASSHLGAITMPAELAARVRIHMQQHRIRVGPIVSHPRSSRWTFLTVPDIPDDKAVYARLFRIQVAVARAHSQITLPSPVRRHREFRIWSQAPSDAYRPSGMAVLAAVEVCAGLSRRARRTGSA